MDRKISIVEKGNVKYLMYEIEPNKVNNLVVGFVKNNEINGVPKALFEKSDNLTATYDISGCIDIINSLPKFAGRDDVFKLIKKIIYAVYELEDYFFMEQDILLCKEHIYVNKNTSEIVLIPAPEVLGGKNTVVDLIFDILSSVNWKKNEDKSYLNRISKVLEKESVNYEEIINQINDELEKTVEHIVWDKNAQESVSVTDATPLGIVGMDELEEKNIKEAPKPPKAPEMSNEPEAPKPPKAPEIPKTVAEPKSPEILGEPKQQGVPNYFDDSFEEKFGQTTVLGMGGNNFGETTVLGTSNTPHICPVIIRLKTQERVVINKNEFWIGKDPSKVDFCIYGNTAISRAHAKIICREGEFYICDNNSTNHVYINGIMIEKMFEVKLGHENRIRLADEEFEFRFQ